MSRRSKKPKFVNPYRTENELCDLFIQYMRDIGWKAYPETSNWDILFVKDIQIGVQAKIKANIDVLSQAIDGIHYNPKTNIENCGPHVRAVLVPRASKEFIKVARALNILVIEGVELYFDWTTKRYSWIKNIKTDVNILYHNYIRAIKKVCWIPEIEINVPAGIKSPKIITPWKISAIKICSLLDKNGFLTTKDFKEAKVSMTLWLKKKWLINSNEKSGKLIKYIRNTNVLLPDQIYIEIVEAFKNN